MTVLKRHLLERGAVPDLCDELSIASDLFYRWQRELFADGQVAFQNGHMSRTAKGVPLFCLS